MQIQYADRPTFLGSTAPIIWLPGETTSDHNQPCVRKPNGTILSVAPNGDYDERDRVKGSWEILVPDAVLNVLHVTPECDSGKIPYVIPFKGA